MPKELEFVLECGTIHLTPCFQIYTGLAEYLTEFELLRTQTEFDDSLTLKIYLLQFVNYYASIFYIAFFKGKFIGYPGEYKRFFKARQEEVNVRMIDSPATHIVELFFISVSLINSVVSAVVSWNCASS